MNEYFIGGSEIDQVLQRQDGAFFVSTADGKTYNVPNQEGNADFHTLELWEQDGGVFTVLEEVDKSGSDYTIKTTDGRTIPVTSDPEDPSLEEVWIQIWAAQGGVISGS